MRHHQNRFNQIYMAHLFSKLILGVMLFSPLFLMGQDSSGSSNQGGSGSSNETKTTTPTIRFQPSIGKYQHRKPSVENDFDCSIYGILEEGNLTIIFEESEGMATLKIEDLTDGSISTMQFHTSAPLILPIGDPSAPLVFTITTDAGNEYQAWL